MKDWKKLLALFPLVRSVSYHDLFIRRMQSLDFNRNLLTMLFGLGARVLLEAIRRVAI